MEARTAVSQVREVGQTAYERTTDSHGENERTPNNNSDPKGILMRDRVISRYLRISQLDNRRSLRTAAVPERGVFPVQIVSQRA